MRFKQRCSAGLVLALFALSLVPLAYSKGKDRAWQNGTLLDTSTDRGTRIVGQNSFRDDVTYYEIDAGNTVYVVARTLRTRRDKALDVTINGHVQFAIQGSTCYLRDAEGKEHKLSIEKKIAK